MLNLSTEHEHDWHLPDDWSIELLDHVAKRGSGHTPNKKIPAYWNGGIKWVSLADSNKLDKRYISQTDKEISELGIKNSSAVIHPLGVVILSRDAGVGKSAITASEMAVSQHFIVWHCGNRLHNLYLYYWLQYMKPEFERIAVGSTIKTIGLPYFKKLRLCLPPIEEQYKIADILNNWDEAIDLTEQLIAGKQRRKQALIQRLLTGQLRFPGFEEEWDEFPVHMFIEKGKAKFDPQKQCEDLPCIELEHVDQATGKLLGSISVQGQQSIKNRFQAGQVLFGKLRPYLKKYARPDFDGVCSSEIWVFSGKENLCINQYLFFLVQSHNFIAAANATSGTKMPRADWEHLSQSIFPLPAIDEQTKITEILVACDQELNLLRQKLTALCQQKQGLMQQLLTGKIRVKV